MFSGTGRSIGEIIIELILVLIVKLNWRNKDELEFCGDDGVFCC